MRTKSPKHAELFLRATGSLDSRDEHDSAGLAVGGGFTTNYLIPRPELPVTPGVTVRELSRQADVMPYCATMFLNIEDA